MKIKNPALLALVLFSLPSCKKDPSIYSLWTNRIDELRNHNETKVTITSGIYGTLTLTEGDCMPKIGGNSCKTYPVRRKIHVYEYTRKNDLEGWGPTYKKVPPNWRQQAFRMKKDSSSFSSLLQTIPFL